jgi:hypothetical protein
MPKSYYLDNAFINSGLRNVAYTPAPIVFLALFTAAPGPGGGGTEVSGGGYGRQPIVFAPPSNGSTSNVSDITFPVAILDWGIVTSYGIFDASSGGNLLYYANLSASRQILTNDQAKFPAGQLIASEQ